MERFLAFESDPQRVTVQIAEDRQTTEANDEFDKMIVEPFLLRSTAECIAEADRNDSGGAF